MINKSRLKDLLSKTDYSKIEKLLICLAVDLEEAKQVKEIGCV